MDFIFVLDVARFGQKHIRRTEQLGLSGIENHDPGQGPDKMRTLRGLPAGLGMRRSCTRFWQRFFSTDFCMCLYSRGGGFSFLTEPFGTLWSQARELFARKKNVHQKRNIRIKTTESVVEYEFFIYLRFSCFFFTERRFVGRTRHSGHSRTKGFYIRS